MPSIKLINDTTFEVELLGKDKVEIGDLESIDFKPSIKLNRWGGECFIKVGLPTKRKIAPVIEGNKTKWIDRDIEVDFYPLESTTVIAKDKDGKDVEFRQNELGGFEFEVILKKKPKTNKIVLDIETQELKFYYQPELTPEEIVNGAVQPDNVVGSYAVYHATKRNHIIGQTNYKCGKAFHIYRPNITDAEGKWTWGELNLDEQAGTLTTIIPQDFLDNAVYPISTGTTNFGYETSGADFTVVWGTNVPYACRFDGAPSSGTLISITAWVSSTALAKWGIYKINGSNVLKDYTVEVSVPGILTEITGNTTQSYSIEEGADYWLALFGDENFNVQYDSGYEYGYGWDSGETYPTWPDPYSPNISGDRWQFSIYCTYEEVAAEQELTASPVAITSSVQNGGISGSGIAPLTSSPVLVASSVQASALAGSGNAPLTGAVIGVASSVVQASIAHTRQYLASSPVAVASSVQNASIVGTGIAPLTASPIAIVSSVVNAEVGFILKAVPVAVTSSVQPSGIAGTGIAPLTAVPVSVTSSVVTGAIENVSAEQELTASSVAIISSVQNSTLSGSGNAPLTSSSVQVASSIQQSTLTAEGEAPLTASPVSVASSVVSSSIENVPAEQELTASPVAVVSSVQSASISGSGNAPLTAAVVDVASGVQNAGISGAGVAELTAASIAVVASIQNSVLAAVGVQILISAPIQVTSSIQIARLDMLGRLLKVMVITSPYRDLNIITSQNRLVQVITSTKRQVKTPTGG